MRLLITFTSLKDCAYLNCYEKLRGFVYSLQKDSLAFNRHDIAGYKLFTFSNIFPIGDLKTNDKRYFQISSPSADFIYYIRGRLSELQEQKKVLNIGEYQFMVNYIQNLSPKVTDNCQLITGTPIVVRIPDYRYEEYGITSTRSYEYWRPEYDFEIFLKQLTDNLIKKYKQFSGREQEVLSLFEQFEFKKSVSVPIVDDGKNISVIGTIWKFKFGHIGKEQREILQLGLDAGFGEMNSSGFGFMNKVEG